MYENFFGMSHTPFTNGIPVDSLYMSSMLDETLGRLEFVADRQLFAVVTADVGCGKTTSVRKFKSMLPEDDYAVLYISDSKLTPRWFYNGLLEQLGLEGQFYRGDARKQLHQQLEIIRGVHRRKVVAIVDEAHLLAKETLEEIRFLLNYRMDSMNPMALILVGQNELWDKLKLQSYSAIRQRIDMKCELPQHDRAQVGEYITAHLAYAGGSTDIFTDKAMDEVYRYSAGSSRATNKVCTHSLMFASQRAKKLIDDHMVRTVIEGELP
ncbi:ExeA family protein [Parasporobacterium paucivorans]|uniref:Type II secretory pathway, component ExeA (Predicted ATPase) n=3 Tax=Parasporobacterium paucivorans DSM 15970 TaxID=1122934 RepID=A0A1M6LRS7_9FIRM|nr:AAA family ATPase [Parasporobacterium paucivorans]SHJ73802.1 Type II secretory pathway, component ExeA (predicted ATPase) [Parasporobacterium paucivorans DSM 15970]